MKKVFSILLVLAMFITMISCSKEETNKDSPDSTTTSAPDENPFEEFFEITWLTQYGDRHVDGRWDEAGIM